MKVLQAIIISMVLLGCSAEEGPQPLTSLNPDGAQSIGDVGGQTGDIPGTRPLDGDNDEVCAMTTCPAGEPGAAGVDGAQGIPGSDGLDGSSCSVIQNGEAATISCTDGTAATVVTPVSVGSVGAVGPAGPVGPRGIQGAIGIQGPPGSNGSTGSQGPAGAPGADGEDGTDGQDGGIAASSVYTVRDVGFKSGVAALQALCNEGDVALGGGCSSTQQGAAFNQSYPAPGDDPEAAPIGWVCTWANATGHTVIAYATCVTVP